MNKINSGIKAVLYNKIGDNFSLLFLILFYSVLSFISYYPELSYSIFLPFTIYFLGIINSFFTTFNIYICIIIFINFWMYSGFTWISLTIDMINTILQLIIIIPIKIIYIRIDDKNRNDK